MLVLLVFIVILIITKTKENLLLLFLLLLVIVIIIIIILFSPLCRVFTIIYSKQSMFLGYIVLQLFCSHNLCCMHCYFALEICFVILH